MRRRAMSMAEGVVATSLALVVVGTTSNEVLRQQRELVAARARGRVNAALRSAAERVRAGLCELPAAGGERALAREMGVELTVGRDPCPLDPRLACEGALVAVTLRAEWAGSPWVGAVRRELVLLVPAGATR